MTEDPGVRRVDAHHHLWDLDRRPHTWLADLPAIRRSYAVDDLRPLLDEARIDGTVLVQVLPSVEETADFLALAAKHPLVRGVVGWVDLTAPDVAQELDRLRGGPGGDRLVGVRHLVQDEDERWLTRPDVLGGLQAVASAGLAYDLLVTVDQLPAATEAVAAVPEGRFVLDHLAKPRIAEGTWQPWADGITALAAHPHVAAKLSGLVTEAGPDWTVEQLRPYAEHALSAFGAERVMVGSDWPVCLLAASYAEVMRAAETLTAGRDRAALWGGTAERWYRL